VLEPRRSIRLLASLLALFGIFGAGVTQAADLTVVVHGIAKEGGDIRVALYAKPETFRKEAQALAVRSQPAKLGDERFVFAGLPKGRYAVIAYHDENRNGKLDLILGMFPAEGWGLSNNPRVIGPPSFEDSAFACSDEAPCQVDIKLTY
jgi:uncharacterized protein (DUF2141 family)